MRLSSVILPAFPCEMSTHIAVVSPSRDARLFLMTPGGPIAVAARGGVPSLEKSVGDPEVSGIGAWTDEPGDARWARPEAGDVLRAMDRFHAIPDVPERASSWAEWLYFNGRSRDGRVRLYLTFLVGPRAAAAGRRTAGVRLQLERDGRSENFSARGEVDEAALLAHAPDLEIAGNTVRLEGLRYHLTLALDGLSGELTLEAAPGRSVPPGDIHGANGWVTGYVVPALAGTLRGTLKTVRETITVDDATGYHDHNWGFWEGVSWQWGQVAHDDLSIVYGRVFPPGDAADAARIQGFLAVLGPEGPLAFSTDVTIDDREPGRVDVRARGRNIDVHLTLDVEETVRTPMAMTRMPAGRSMSFLQLGGVFRVSGRVADRGVDFTARGAAETFRAE